ncbi:hypothetical protein C2E21_4534 [Chlorella sorokiniana]|uniref:Uncharacterized protein n=1 Tax=Chlorella sorokiniana TaxID=3076 RepID=A0A2P6TQR1_CHLSO|nr:hypothetical protein C2E21_4534 [Chlorella sorokiniana]|eukprot:PRW56398.1 hypothetical protein C2E21_4534 [Chlorella sorokiniana]
MTLEGSHAENANESIVRQAMVQIQSEAGLGSGPIMGLSPAFTLCVNGVRYDLPGFLSMWRDRREQLQELSFSFEDVCCRGDRVAVFRSASVVAKDGTRQLGIAVFDVWRVVGGQIVSGEQCWQRLRGPAGDDIPHTPKEGRLEEAVRKAMLGLHKLSGVQAHLRKHWAPDFSGTINGQQLDLAALCAHWGALQAVLTTVLIDVKQSIVHGNCVAAIYHVLCGRADRQAAELRCVAIFRVDPSSRCIVGSDAVVRLISGAPEDEGLPTLMPA